jgi:hypothetical protein
MESERNSTDLDKNALLLDAEGLVEGDELLRLLLGSLLVEGETGIDLGGHTARDDVKDLLAELDKLDGIALSDGHQNVRRCRTYETVNCEACLLLQAATLLLGGLDGAVDEAGIAGLVGGGQDQGGVCGRILIAHGSG